MPSHTLWALWVRQLTWCGLAVAACASEVRPETENTSAAAAPSVAVDLTTRRKDVVICTFPSIRKLILEDASPKAGRDAPVSPRSPSCGRVSAKKRMQVLDLLPDGYELILDPGQAHENRLI
jgi:hypothetical protein